jgi:phosphate transport system substrate-binding protein
VGNQVSGLKVFFAGIFLMLLLSCVDGHQVVKIKGSDTEVNLAVLLVESFQQENDHLVISVSGGGSGLGIASLLNGNAHIANASRRINQEELVLFRERNINLDSFVFAQDAIAFVVSDRLPIDSLGIADLSKILKGEEKDWKFLTNRSKPVNVYGRQSNSGTYEFLKQILGIRFSPYAKQMNGNAQILEAIKTDDSGIGYVGAGYVGDGNLKGLKVLRIFKGTGVAVSPLDAEAIASGRYFFQRPLYQYYRKSDYERVKPFIVFQKSSRGAEIIRKSGYYLSRHDQ